MNKPSNEFRNQLLRQETKDLQLQEKFNQEVKKMYTEKLKKSQRIAHVLAGLLIALFTGFFWALSKLYEDLQIQCQMSSVEPLRLMSVWAMFLSTALLGFVLWPAIIGKAGLRIYPKFIRLTSWLLILVTAALFISNMYALNAMGDPGDLTEAIWISVLATLILIMGIYLLLSGRLDRLEMNTKKQALEYQYRIAELKEEIKNQR